MRVPEMRPSPVLRAAQVLGLTAAVLFAGVADAAARGGGAPGGGGHGVPGIGHGRGVHWGKGHGYHGRYGGRERRRAYYPSGGYGGYDWPVAGAGVEAAAGAREPASRTDFLYTKSVVIHRGPSFGEPGYYSRASIYRITPEGTKRAGTKRYRVERTDF